MSVTLSVGRCGTPVAPEFAPDTVKVMTVTTGLTVAEMTRTDDGTLNERLTDAYEWADWATRAPAPLTLDQAGLHDQADQLRDLDPVIDEHSAQRAAEAAYQMADALEAGEGTHRAALALRSAASAATLAASGADFDLASHEAVEVANHCQQAGAHIGTSQELAVELVALSPAVVTFDELDLTVSRINSLGQRGTEQALVVLRSDDQPKALDQLVESCEAYVTIQGQRPPILERLAAKAAHTPEQDAGRGHVRSLTR